MMLAVTLGLTMLAVPISFTTRAHVHAQPTEPPVANRPAVNPANREAVQARLDAARRVYELGIQRLQAQIGQVGAESHYQWSRRWMESQQALSDKKEASVAAIRDHLQRMQELQKWMEKLAAVERGARYDAEATTYFVLEAQQWLRDGQAK